MKSIHAWGFLLFAAAFSSACSDIDETGDGGGGGGGGTTGPVTVVITDAASDQIVSCVVEVNNVRLVASGGGEVQLLASPVQVDLASLSDVSQLLVSTGVPSGMYTQVNLSVDFFGATCHLVGLGGAADIVDPSGNPVDGTIQIPLMLASPITVGPNTHKLLEIDFDLDQSFTVDMVGNTVTLQPAILLRVDPAMPKEISTAATRVSVNTATSTFVGAVHGLGGVTVSTVTFHTGPGTVFQIDGAILTGAAGLAALAALPPGTPVDCFGDVAASSANFEVLHCQVGTGTSDGGTDFIEGDVIGRTGGPGMDAILQVFGRSDDASHSSQAQATSFQVNTSFASTKVVLTGSANVLDMDDVNVGQRVRIYGTLTGTTMDATAADSVIRLVRTSVFGIATSAPIGVIVTIDLGFVGQLPETAFMWSDGGGTPPDPDLFSVNVGALANGLAIVPGTQFSAHGFFPAIDDVNADFVASAVENVDTGSALLLVRNLVGTGMTVDVTTTTTQIQLVLGGVAVMGEVAFVDRGQGGSTALPASPAPKLNHASMAGTYSLRDRGANTIQVFTQFSDYASALGSVIAQGATLVQIGANGTYNAGTNTMDAAVSAAVIE